MSRRTMVQDSYPAPAVEPGHRADEPPAERSGARWVEVCSLCAAEAERAPAEWWELWTISPVCYVCGHHRAGYAIPWTAARALLAARGQLTLPGLGLGDGDLVSPAAAAGGARRSGDGGAAAADVQQPPPGEPRALHLPSPDGLSGGGAPARSAATATTAAARTARGGGR